MAPEHDEYTVNMNPSPNPNGEIAVLFVGEAQPVPLHKMGPAIHDYYLIHTVLSGRGDFSIGGKSYRCGAGDSFMIFPGEMFSYQADEHEPWRYAWIAFVGRGAEAVVSSLGVAPEDAVVPGSLNAKVRHYYDQLLQCFDSSQSPELSNLEAGGWARLLLRQFGTARAKTDKKDPEIAEASERVVKRAIQFLTLQFAQPISISRLAGLLGYHRTHLCKLFKQSTGMSPMQYLLQIRMQRAELLLGTSMPIEQIASSVGFGDPLYFSRKFRSWSGQSPTDYRRTIRIDSKRIDV